jgi:hypothetical protein
MNKPYVLVTIGKFLVFNIYIWQKLIRDLTIRLRFKIISFAPPRYMFISYELNFLYLFRYPNRNDLVYPIAIDIQRLTGYN